MIRGERVTVKPNDPAVTAAASMVAAPTHLISYGLYTIVALPFPRLTLRERAASSPCLAVLPLVPPHGLVGQTHHFPFRGVMPETVPHRDD
jgi:hypothetical protein